MIRIEDLVNRLIELTKAKKVAWTAMEGRRAIPAFSKFMKAHYGNDVLAAIAGSARSADLENTFATKWKKGYIFVITENYDRSLRTMTRSKEVLLLGASSNPGAPVELLNAEEEYQAEIKRLRELIRRDLQNVDDFLEDIMRG